LKKTREAAQRARDLDPSLAEPDATLGYVAFYDGSLKDAAALLQRSLDLNPNLAFAHRYYAPVLSAQGRPDLGLEAARRAVELDPLSLVNCSVYARALANAQRYAEAVEASARAIRLETGSGPLTHWPRPIALWVLGRRPEAIDEARIVLRSDMRGAFDAEALWVLHAAGLRDEVANNLKKIGAQTAADSYLRGFNLVAVGRPDEAWPFLLRTPRGNALNFLHYSVVFDSVRQDSRFPQLIVQLGYAEEYKVARATLARMLGERVTPK
jgi:tetratricopeptide (TPR) repeat protein